MDEGGKENPLGYLRSVNTGRGGQGNGGRGVDGMGGDMVSASGEDVDKL